MEGYFGKCRHGQGAFRAQFRQEGIDQLIGTARIIVELRVCGMQEDRPSFLQAHRSQGPDQFFRAVFLPEGDRLKLLAVKSHRSISQHPIDVRSMPGANLSGFRHESPDFSQVIFHHEENRGALNGQGPIFSIHKMNSSWYEQFIT